MKDPLKITFDSNVWRQVATPENFPKDPMIDYYRTIRAAINNGKISPYLSETIFTIEAIKRVDRKQFFRDYRADTKTISQMGEDGYIKTTIVMGPNENAHPGNNEFLKAHLFDAASLGFKIIRLPRIAGITNKEIEAYRYKMDGKSLSDYHNKVFEVAERIRGLKAGEYVIEQLGLKYDKTSWFKGIGKAPDSEDGVIASAVAEWADGDSVASHIAINGDYFCTNDSAKKAGINSVFSEKNTKTLEKEYGFKKISIKELAEIVK